MYVFVERRVDRELPFLVIDLQFQYSQELLYDLSCISYEQQKN